MKLKHTLVLTLLSAVLSMNQLIAQDLIATNDGDSVNCVITKIKKDYIYFTFKHDGEIRSTLIPASDVKYYQKDYYETGEVSKDQVKNYGNYQHVKFTIYGGYTYLVAKIDESTPKDFIEYTNDLKSGYHFGGEVSYYFTENVGMGFRYISFRTSNSVDRIYTIDSLGNTRYGSMSDDIRVTYLGPSLAVRYLNHNKNGAFYTSLSLGYLGYSNDFVLIDDYKLTGETVGLVYDFGYFISLSENVSFGYQLSYLAGTLFEMKRDDGNTIETIKYEQGEYLGLSRFDISVGLKIGF